MTIDGLLTALQSTPLAQHVGSGDWDFPVIETMHVMCISIVAGSILVVDLRLLGFAGRLRAVSDVVKEYLPYTWTAWGLAAITGSTLFTSSALRYFHTTPFRLKFLWMGLAAINMLVFHSGIYRRVQEWDHQLPPPLAARWAGGISILLWCGVITMGRLTGWSK